MQDGSKLKTLPFLTDTFLSSFLFSLCISRIKIAGGKCLAGALAVILASSNNICNRSLSCMTA